MLVGVVMIQVQPGRSAEWCDDVGGDGDGDGGLLTAKYMDTVMRWSQRSLLVGDDTRQQ